MFITQDALSAGIGQLHSVITSVVPDSVWVAVLLYLSTIAALRGAPDIRRYTPGSVEAYWIGCLAATALGIALILFADPVPVSISVTSTWQAQAVQGATNNLTSLSADTWLYTTVNTVLFGFVAAGFAIGILRAALLAGCYMQRTAAFTRHSTPVKHGKLQDWESNNRTMGLQIRICRADKQSGPTQPTCYGVINPTILLPAHATQWSSNDLTRILAHEYAHLQRRDPIRLLVTLLICEICWFVPSLRRCVEQWQHSMEACCDERATDLLRQRYQNDTHTPLSYVETLLRVLRSQSEISNTLTSRRLRATNMGMTVGMAGGSVLRRCEALLQQKQCIGSETVFWRICLLTCLPMLLLTELQIQQTAMPGTQWMQIDPHSVAPEAPKASAALTLNLRAGTAPAQDAFPEAAQPRSAARSRRPEGSVF